jgi:hypothetical protein
MRFFYAESVVQRSPGLADKSWPTLGMGDMGDVNPVRVAQDVQSNQEQHHRKELFQDEFRRLSRKYEMDFDECHVWIGVLQNPFRVRASILS